MQHIDAFCHFFPHGIFQKLSETTGGTRDIGKRIQGVRTIYDLDARFRIMDGFANYSQVLSLGLPAIEGMVGPDRAPGEIELARFGGADQPCQKEAAAEIAGKSDPDKGGYQPC